MEDEKLRGRCAHNGCVVVDKRALINTFMLPSNCQRIIILCNLRNGKIY